MPTSNYFSCPLFRDMVRAYEKANPSIKKNWTDVAKAILEREESFSTASIDFTEHESADPPSRKLKLLRFQQNPPNWGPKSKATKFCGEKFEKVDKREKNQGKYSSKRQISIESEMEPGKKEKLDPVDKEFSS